MILWLQGKYIYSVALQRGVGCLRLSIHARGWRAAPAQPPAAGKTLSEHRTGGRHCAYTNARHWKGFSWLLVLHQPNPTKHWSWNNMRHQAQPHNHYALWQQKGQRLSPPGPRSPRKPPARTTGVLVLRFDIEVCVPRGKTRRNSRCLHAQPVN